MDVKTQQLVNIIQPKIRNMALDISRLCLEGIVRAGESREKAAEALGETIHLVSVDLAQYLIGATKEIKF